MRFLFLGLACISLFIIAEAGFPFTFGSNRSGSFRERMDNIKRKLRNRNMTSNDALDEADGDWQEIEDDDTLFEAAADEFEVPVKNSTEKSRRRNFFNRNLGRIQNLTNRHRNARFGINKFTFMDDDEAKSYLMKPIPVTDLPNENPQRFGNNRRKRQATSVDLRSKKAVGAIRNQGSCGSCWSFATVNTMESAHFKRTGKLLDLSEQYFVNCDTLDNGCNGGWMSSAYTFARTNGIPEEKTNQYVAKKNTCKAATGTLVKVANYTQLYPRDTTSMMNALNQGYTLAVAMRAGTSEFMSYRSGILDDPTDCPDNSVDHGVNIVGYGTANNIPYWILRNSWGTSWGEAGYARIKRGINYCNIEYYPFFVSTM